MKNAIIKYLTYSHEHGTDPDEITPWKWPY